MTAPKTSLSVRTRALLASFLGVLLLAGGLLVSPGRAGSAPLRVIVMGKTVNTPQPQPCSAEGHVTGFQSLTSDGTIRPFEATSEGKIVSWSISLANPLSDKDSGKECQRFFFSLFGRQSSARISILKPVDESPPKYKLVRQSPLETLNPYFGTTPQFVLDHPLTVLRGQVVALTVPTWAPMFNGLLSSGDTWRGSRVKGHCEYPDPTAVPFEQVKAFADSSYPQQKVGSTKQYGCYYQANRLLYTATFVKKPGA